MEQSARDLYTSRETQGLREDTQEEVSEETVSALPLKDKGGVSQWDVKTGWDSGPFSAILAPGHTSPPATKHKETLWHEK